MLPRICANKVFSREHYDTIVSFMESGPAKFHSYVLGRGKRNISWVHCDLLHNHYTTAFFPRLRSEKKFYAALNEVVFVSKDAKNSFSKLFQMDKGRVIYNIIDRLVKVMSPNAGESPLSMWEVSKKSNDKTE